MSRAWLRPAIAVLTTGLSLVAAEYAARFVFRKTHSSGNSRDYVAVRGGGPMPVTNKLGFREREIPPKNPERYRIAVVGDSFTWGQGIEEAQRFSNLLEGLLGPGFEVLNFGRPGNNMPEHLEVLEQALPVAPDFILLQLYINDFETRQMARPQPYPLLPASWHSSLERSSLLYDLINQRWEEWQPALGIVDDYVGYMARNLRDPAAPNSQLAFGMLSRFMERARQAGVASGAVLFPATDAMGPNGSRISVRLPPCARCGHVRRGQGAMPGSPAGLFDDSRSAHHVGQSLRRASQRDGQPACRTGDPSTVRSSMVCSTSASKVRHVP